MADITTNLLPERARLESGDSFLVDTAAGTGRISIGNAKNQLTRGENILDNTYFLDPIDQRNGHIVESGVTYYSDAALTTSAGTTSSAMTAQYVNGTYGTITINGTTYYVAAANVVRGYVKNTYSIDRWKLTGNGGQKLELLNDGALITSTAAYGAYWEQLVDPDLCRALVGKQLCLSVIGTENSGEFVVSVYFNGVWTTGVAVKNGLAMHVFKTPENLKGLRISIAANGTGTTKVAAIKLELGEHQTLAHQDASGNWVLNDPPPNKALELLKCQRYYCKIKNDRSDRPINVCYGSSARADNTFSNFLIPIPARMRAIPAVKFTMLNLYDINTGQLFELTADNISVISMTDSYIHVNAHGNSVPSGKLYLYTLPENEEITISADL